MMLAYLKTTPVVSARRPANQLLFPVNFRFLLNGWNLLGFRPGEFTVTDAAKSSEWEPRRLPRQRVWAIADACHTPKTFLIAGDKGGVALQGGHSLRLGRAGPDLERSHRSWRLERR